MKLKLNKDGSMFIESNSQPIWTTNDDEEIQLQHITKIYKGSNKLKIENIYVRRISYDSHTVSFDLDCYKERTIGAEYKPSLNGTITLPVDHEFVSVLIDRLRDRKSFTIEVN